MNDTPEPRSPDEPERPAAASRTPRTPGHPTTPIAPPPFGGGDEPASARTTPMPAVRRPDLADDVRSAPARDRVMRAAPTPWLVIVGVLLVLLVAAGVYVLGSDRSPGAGAGSSTSTAPISADATTHGTATGEVGPTDQGSSENAPTSAAESPGLSTKPDTKKQPGMGSCKAVTTPKKSGGTLVQDVVISCAQPTSLTIETAGKSVVTLNGDKHTGTVQICAEQVGFTVTGGAYKWSADGPCEP